MPRSQVQCPLTVEVAVSSLGVQGLTPVHGLLLTECVHAMHQADLAHGLREMNHAHAWLIPADMHAHGCVLVPG